jgi:hypothetical protein
VVMLFVVVVVVVVATMWTYTVDMKSEFLKF